MNKTAISLLSLISVFSIMCSSLFADKSDDTLLIAFKRELLILITTTTVQKQCLIY